MSATPEGIARCDLEVAVLLPAAGFGTQDGHRDVGGLVAGRGVDVVVRGEDPDSRY